VKNGRLLIVDDEPYTADSLSELFGALDSLSVEVFTAYSAREALGVLDAHAVDVVLTDVKMPKMSGIELQRVIAGRWPRCKVVFLSGFNDFEYIQSVIRHGGIDYVLKTESDEQIVSAVKNAFSRADEEERRRSLLEEARRQIEAARPLFKRELFLEVLTSPSLDLSSVSERLASLELPLSGDRPVFLFLGRIDAPRQVVYDPESTSRLFRVEELSTAHLRSCFNAACVHVDQRKLAWLAQPTGLDDCSIGELLEAAQDDCREILDTTLSFAYEVEPLQWIDCSRGLRRLERLLGRGSGLGSGVIVRPDSREPSAGEEAVFAVSSRTAALDTLLEAREAEDLHAEIDAILHEVGSGGVPGYEPALQAFSLLSGVFISYLTRRNLYRPVSAEVDCTFLTNFDRFDSWDDIASYFHDSTSAEPEPCCRRGLMKSG
jgi:two-component system response regulator YesN